ncbi:MAG: hypothetical protein HYU88_08880 [Chloroflexi bacterium]|nr:hypothetical protein [Chloroflexota bacterium]
MATASWLATRGPALLGLAALGWLLAIAPLRLAALLVAVVLGVPLVLAYPPRSPSARCGWGCHRS